MLCVKSVSESCSPPKDGSLIKGYVLANCSPSERVKRLVAEQQRIQRELAEVQEEAGDLSTDERAEIQALLAAAEPPPPATDRQSDAGQQLQKGKKRGRRKGKSNLPPDVAKFFSGPGVLDAMDSTGAPREPTDETGQSNSDKLKVLLCSFFACYSALASTAASEAFKGKLIGGKLLLTFVAEEYHEGFKWEHALCLTVSIFTLLTKEL